MGGIGSGAKRSTNVGNLEDTLSLDIRALRRLGIVRVGECIIDTVQWSIDGLEAPTARLRVDLSDIKGGGALRITANMPGRDIEQKIAIEAVPSGFGGYRCYFICPVNRKRCEVLYYAHGRFASRKAQRLTYAVQGMTELSRARRKIAKLHSRIDGTKRFARARGMNRMKRVAKLKQSIEYASEIHVRRISARVHPSQCCQ